MNVPKVSPVAFLGTMTTNLSKPYHKALGDKPNMLRAMQNFDEFVKNALPKGAEVQVNFTTTTRPQIHKGKLETVTIDKDTPKSKIQVTIVPDKEIDPEKKVQAVLKEPFAATLFADKIDAIESALESLYS